MYDIIGDIHGHADELVKLLQLLGYEKRQGAYRHPQRMALFLGDWIDRGPQIRAVLECVRAMIESGSALAVLGNHELNALAFHTENQAAPGEYLRVHSAKNMRQHQATLDQLTPGELRGYLEWFRTIPLWLELDGLRAVHACWSDRELNQVAAALDAAGGLTSEFLQGAYHKGQPLYAAVEVILKGRQGDLPSGLEYQDKDGHSRNEMRTRWYADPAGHTYRTYALDSNVIPCDLPLADSILTAAVPYPADAKPVFVGHYWLSDPRPELLTHNVACLDYSVAKGGFLCAYRWNGEQRLHRDHFAWNSASV